VVIQNSGSFGRYLGNVKATYPNVPNARSFQMFILTEIRKDSSVVYTSPTKANK
jgi:hypothetical protein